PQRASARESGGGSPRATIVRGYRADACVILEPMNLRLAPVQTGALTFRITVNGRAAHACMRPHGVSAITEFLPIASALEHLNADRHQRYRAPMSDALPNIAH